MIEVIVELVCLGFPESTTVAVKLNVPLTLGVPEITPVAATRERPGGNCPNVMDHVYADVPPVALSVPAYGWFAVPPGRVAELITSWLEDEAGAATVTGTGCDCSPSCKFWTCS